MVITGCSRNKISVVRVKLAALLGGSQLKTALIFPSDSILETQIWRLMQSSSYLVHVSTLYFIVAPEIDAVT